MKSLSRITTRVRFGLVIVVQLSIVSAQAAGPRSDYTPHLSGPVRVLPPDVAKGEGIGLTKTSYKDGEAWQALVCRQDCVLEPVALNVRREVLQQDTDDTMTGLRLRVAKPPSGELIALFQGLPIAAGKNSLISLLHRGMASYPGSGRPGTQEIGIPSLGTEKLRIVPRLTNSKDSMRIYLENSLRRQLLGEFEFSGFVGYSNMPKGRELLHWAGDLDGDGKTDLVMGFAHWVGVDTSVTLFLSSLAKDGNFVGNGGSFFLAGQYD